MNLLDFSLPGSDPTTPNAFVQTPDQIARARALADALSREGTNYSPVQSPWQGAARLAQALAGAVSNYRADQAQRLATADALADQSNVLNRNGIPNDPGEQTIPATPGQTTPALRESDAAIDASVFPELGGAGANPRAAALASALGGGAASAPATGGDGNRMALAAALGGGTPYGTSNIGGGAANYGGAIAGIESGGNYGALGPVTPSGDRAYGKYQVMGANIPQWTQAALGRSMTPQEFLADKAAQDAVFNHQFGGYVQKYGPRDAASMWLTGRTLANGGATARDQNGTTGQNYADQFTRNLGASPASAAISTATGSSAINADAAQGNRYLDATAKANGMGNGITEQQAIAIATGQPGAAPPAYAPGVVDRLSPEAAASPLARPASPPSFASPSPSPSPGDLGALRTAMTSQPTPSVTASMSGQPAEAPAKAISPSPYPVAPNPMHGDIAGLLRVASNPWTPAAGQQVAGALLQNQLPQKPSIIEGPTDPQTGYATKLVWSPTQGVLGRLNADGTVTPAGASNGATATNAPPVPAGVDPATWRKTLAEIAAKRANPTAADELDFAHKVRETPSYKEYAESISTANALPNLAKENSPAGDTALIDSVAKLVNPGLAVRQGTYAVYQDEQSGLNKLYGEISKVWNQNAVLQPETRAQLMRIANEKMQQYRTAWETDAAQATKIAKANGLDPDRVVPAVTPLAPLNYNTINTEHTQAGPVAGMVIKMQADPQGALAQARTLLQSRPDLRPQVIQRLQAAGIDPRGL